MSIIPHRRCLGTLVLLLLVIVLMLHPAVFTLTQASIWSQTYGGGYPDAAFALIQTSDGGYALAGTTWSYGAGSDDYWLTKTDSNGRSQWNQTYGGVEPDGAYALIQTSDGGYALAGWTESYGAGSVDCWLVKTDSNGRSQWSQTYGGGYPDVAFALVQTSDGGYALAGTTESYGAGSADYWLMKTDSNGRSQWNQTYGGVEYDGIYALIQTSDGGYALAGTTESYGAGSADCWLVKTDSNGRSQWSQTYGGGYPDAAFALIQTSDGGYALAGWTESYGAGSVDCWLVKTDSNGRSQWNQTYGGVEYDGAYALIQTSDGGYALAGSTASYGVSPDYLLVKTDRNGISQWSQTYGRRHPDAANALIQTSDGGYALAGWISSYGARFDCWLVKTDKNGINQWNQTYGGENYDDAQALIQTSDGGYALAGTTESYGAGSADYWLVKTAGLDFPNASTTTAGLDFPNASTTTAGLDVPITILWY
ncbi:MAG: hypothetical protein ACFFCZ_02830, partial [Promethearchaeota archaeon]